MIDFDVSGKKISLGWNEAYDFLYVRIKPHFDKVIIQRDHRLEVSTIYSTPEPIEFIKRRDGVRASELLPKNLPMANYDFEVYKNLDLTVKPLKVINKSVGEYGETQFKVYEHSKNIDNQRIEVIIESDVYIPNTLFWLKFKNDNWIEFYDSEMCKLFLLEMKEKNSKNNSTGRKFITSYIVRKDVYNKIELSFSEYIKDFIKVVKK